MTQAVVDHRFRPRGNSSKLFRHVTWGQQHPQDRLLEILWEGPAGAGGKTTCSLHLAVMLCEAYPGCRGILARDVKADLAISVLPTLEEKVLPAGHPFLDGRRREGRSSYVHPNGSRLDLMGFAVAERLRSGEWDFLIVCEANAITWEDWQDATSRLRNGVLPQPFAIAETNPDQPMHWLNQRANEGKMIRLVGRYEDNPFFWDDGNWTTQGRQYVCGTLEELTGVRYLRLRQGQWAAAEGLIYDEWDPELHMIDREEVPGYKLDDHGNPSWGFKWTFVTVDWGIRAPGVMQVWGVDRDDRLYRVCEIYRTQEVQDWWADRAEEVYKEFNPVAFVCDTDRPEAIDKFNDRLTPYMGRSVAPICRPVAKKLMGKRRGWVIDGIDLVKERLKPDASGKPSIFLVRGCQRFRDEALIKAKKPTCTEDEITGYTWVEHLNGKPLKEEPDPVCPDHGCFPAGTMVDLVDGSKMPIEAIQAGFSVLTPNGPEVVVDACMTARDAPLVEIVHDQGTLRCTPDHPVWVHGHGMMRADALRYGMMVAWNTAARSGIWTGTGTTGEVRRRAGTTRGSTDACTRTTSDRSQRVTRCTTRTETRPTTTPRTWRRSTPGTTPSSTSGTSRRPGRPRGLGTGLQMAWNGTGSTPENVGSGSRPTFLNACAPAVGVRTSPVHGSSGSARTRARVVHAVPAGLTTRPAPAHAAGSFARTDTAIPGHALRRVLGVYGAGRADVYNLTVGTTHAFYADGVLVSNCDALRYAAAFVWGRDHGERPQTKKIITPRSTIGDIFGIEKELGR